MIEKTKELSLEELKRKIRMLYMAEIVLTFNKF